MKPKDLADFGNMLYCSPKETMSHTCGPPGDQATTSSFRLFIHQRPVLLWGDSATNYLQPNKWWKNELQSFPVPFGRSRSGGESPEKIYTKSSWSGRSTGFHHPFPLATWADPAVCRATCHSSLRQRRQKGRPVVRQWPPSTEVRMSQEDGWLAQRCLRISSHTRTLICVYISYVLQIQ